MERKFEQGLVAKNPVETIRQAITPIKNPFLGWRDRHMFREAVEIAVEQAGDMSTDQILAAQKVVTETAQFLINTHGHIPRAKLASLIQLGQAFFVDPLHPNSEGL